MLETYKIKDLEQLRLLSDPLKLQLLQAFAVPNTTKKVAEELGESVTKLYRHVDALQDAGFLTVISEQQKRGTVERTFQAVAARFEADHALFQGEQGGDGRDAARDLLRVAEDEILDAIALGDESKFLPVFARVRCKRTPEKFEELQKLLADWIESAQEDDKEMDEDLIEAGALIAFYPIEE